ncbi:MAG TPA: acetyl-CoA carboxylase biotin carboxylase subunit [Candidatus Limnocylindria bacterium]|nr:acetyl-CoA carboxylase biotin carboxylase subunit [Candidatus Limnocylindria bacterium]
MFSKILVANRGEIAVRVIRACKEMGIRTVAVYSEVDREALHVSLADESICVGPASSTLSYLNQTALLSAARSTGCKAVHPGYGFLSENADFADLCARHGLKFIGPSGSVIRRMGNKDEAKRTVAAAGVPVIPGRENIETLEDAQKAAEEVGYPLLIKARGGGGGKGIRRVSRPGELKGAFSAAAQEARSSFSDAGLYVEKLLEDVKHIEIQVLCDSHGNAVCFGERDCSMQRRHKKMLEESPCALMAPALRARMQKSAKQAIKNIGYEGAGTLEFLMDKSGNYYFMEMNTRLQVEHPVTEFVSGMDLVKWQIRVAAGAALPFSQKDVRVSGHAIECRINAEDPARAFMPTGGTVGILHIPGGPSVRFDSALYQGYRVPLHYDSLLAKLIVHAPTREEAIRKMQAALCETVIEGVDHTALFQAELLSRPPFEDGSYTTSYLEGKTADAE